MNTFRQLVASERPLVLPGAHDAISARLIQRAGFKAYFIGGFPLVGARYGVPDIGLMGLGEIEAGIRDTMAASDLPVLVDCDNGYGDVKTVVHTINAYERLGAQAVFFEDQISPKRCGHIHGKRLLSTEQMEANIRAAAENRTNPETFIIARTDAREVFQSAFLFSFALLVAPFVLIPTVRKRSILRTVLRRKRTGPRRALPIPSQLFFKELSASPPPWEI